MLPQEETDLSFADFGGSKRLYPAPSDLSDAPNKNAPGLSDRGQWKNLEHETGFSGAVRPGRTAR
jgi:hypothetical protein